jgi:TRAP transporter TAXI family solute receptor
MLSRWAGLALAVALPAAAQELQGNIVTGPAAGTDLAIGRDIAALAADCGLTLNVRESAGSVENMQAVRDRRVTQFGIVQSDVLEYYQTFQGDDPALRRAAEGVRVAFPLYDAEVHLLARREIDDLAGLAGRRVAIGLPDGGTHLTAELVLDLAGVAPAEKLAIGPEAALAALRAGEIDAMFDVTGVPAELYAGVDDPDLHLLPLGGPVLEAVYAPAEIAAGSYPFVAAPVKTVAVRTVLVTFDFDPGRNAYQAASCRLVADVSHLVLTRLERLRETGHPEWGAVDFTAIPPGWTVGACVLDGLAPDYAFACRRPDGSVVAEGTPEGEPNALYRSRVCARLRC